MIDDPSQKREGSSSLSRLESICQAKPLENAPLFVDTKTVTNAYQAKRF
jgi:hypothetical protein